MTQSKDSSNPVFNPGQARWLRERGGQDLDQDQQALLLALAQLEKELGRKLSEDESEAIETLTSQMEGFNPEQIAAAVHEMVERPADPSRKTSWPEIKRRK